MNTASAQNAAAAATASASSQDAAVPALPAAGANAANFKPDGVVIHLTPMASRPRHSVQVRVGEGEDCPVVRLPASVWFDSKGRLMAVATPMTDSDVEEEEEKKEKDKAMGTKSKQPEVVDIDDDDDDDDVICLN